MATNGFTENRVADDSAMKNTVALDARPARMRLTARGRRLVGGLVLVAALLGFGALASQPAFAAVVGATSTSELETVTVSAGETLWEIAEETAESRDVRDVLADIQGLNQLDGSHVEPGQVLFLPADR
ncbi:MAG: LysM peptidoglycan-binding domain-containing protein [Pseudoclavibacter sp.]